MVDYDRENGPEINQTTPYFRPWGSKGATAILASLFCVWISIVNVFLLALILTSRDLRRQRVVVFVLHIALADLAVGIFYFPLTADFFINQHWVHDCDSLFWWNALCFPVICISTLSIGIINVYGLCSLASRLTVRHSVKNILTIILVVLFWFYFVMMCASLQNFRILGTKVMLSSQEECPSFIDDTGVIVTSLLVYYVPAIIIVIVYVFSLIARSKLPTPVTHEELHRQSTDSPVLSLQVTGLANAVALLMPLPYFTTLVAISHGRCSLLECSSWVLPILTIFDWLLFTKSGIQPLVWFVVDGPFKDAIRSMWVSFRSGPETPLPLHSISESYIPEDSDILPEM